MSDYFKYEKDFEDAIVSLLPQKGWNPEIIEYPDEQALIENWKKILFDNNRKETALNDFPLTDGEMNQILAKIRELKTPLALNSGFINGEKIAIIRDNKEDKLNYGRTVYLTIYDRAEIAGGTSRYQIVRQPRFNVPNSIYPERRGDLMLLINGMPLIHIELKASGHHLSEATNQIQKYHKEGIFKGIFSLVQIFAAMTPEDSIYFANPGDWQNFNPSFFFHWADKDNNPYHDWKDFVSHLLNIPMAHQLIGFYTVADLSDGVLKVMRSYQYYAAWAITDKVGKTDWTKENWTYEDQLGGYVWHTTGAGKTMTSFKSAQLIADLGAQFADKVIFLLDRIELGNQTFSDYKGFAGDLISVRDTENTDILKEMLKSTMKSDKLIVTSIQKMNIVAKEDSAKIKNMTDKKVVFIIDECHRDVFGDMLSNIKNAFKKALFFGFTGTPIFEVNQKNRNTTVDIFGSELHRYTVAEGITDKNVLGFDSYPVCTFELDKIKEVIALDMAKAKSLTEVLADEDKKKVFYEWYNSKKMEMAGHIDEKTGKYVKGYEDYLPLAQYHTKEHQKMVVEDIKKHWLIYSAGLFHAILATSSIKEAVEYYRLLKADIPEMKVTALFDPTIDNTGDSAFDKEDGLEEIMLDYNKRYQQNFKFETHPLFKKDVASRLAHKESYLGIQKRPEEQIDLLIVVNQMLTGFDSKWLNTLYLDKEMEYEGIIQAFSRTNRLYKEQDKPFGIIRYYRRPFTMEKRIYQAFKTYSGDRPADVFVSKLNENIEEMNKCFEEIKPLFIKKGKSEPDFSVLPEEMADRGQFVKLFNKFNSYLEAAKVQGFVWKEKSYLINDVVYSVDINPEEYEALLLRYKELKTQSPTPGPGDNQIPYDLKGHLVEADTEKIDADFMNSNFAKWIKARMQNESAEEVQKAKDALHKTFANLSKEDQVYANMFLHDIEMGSIVIEDGKSFRDYVILYKANAKSTQFNKLKETFGLNEQLLKNCIDSFAAGNDINSNGHFQDLLDSVDFDKAVAYFEKKTGTQMDPPDVYAELDNLMREFIEKGGFDLNGDK